VTVAIFATIAVFGAAVAFLARLADDGESVVIAVVGLLSTLLAVFGAAGTLISLVWQGVL
jgi:hypothetical protein